MKNLLIFDFSDTLVSSKTGQVLVPKKKLMELRTKGYQIALFSAGNKTAAEKSCLRNFKGVFDFCVFREDVLETKPSPEGVQKIIRKLKLRGVIYIGDSENDFKSAQAAGASFLTPDLIYLL